MSMKRAVAIAFCVFLVFFLIFNSLDYSSTPDAQGHSSMADLTGESSHASKDSISRPIKFLSWVDNENAAQKSSSSHVIMPKMGNQTLR
jgi:hypothetical protein